MITEGLSGVTHGYITLDFSLMKPRHLALLSIITILTAHADRIYWVNGVSMTAEQYRQYQQDRAWREQDERKRQEALAISLADQERERDKTANALSDLNRLNRESAAAAAITASKEMAEAERSRIKRAAEASAQNDALAKQAAIIEKSKDCVEIEREVRRHVREEAITQERAGKITKGEAMRRMRYSTPAREAILEDFKAGRIDKETAFAQLADDDRGMNVADGKSEAPPVMKTAANAADAKPARPLGDPAMTARREAADVWLAKVFGGAAKVPVAARAVEYARMVVRTTPMGYDNPYLREILDRSGTRRVLTPEDKTFINTKILAMRDVMDALRQGDITPDDARTNLDAIMADIKAL